VLTYQCMARLRVRFSRRTKLQRSSSAELQLFVAMPIF
jgi:hypothetical protein